MEVFSRKRWMLVSAQLIVLNGLTVSIILGFQKCNKLGQYESSSPSPKEFHLFLNSTFCWSNDTYYLHPHKPESVDTLMVLNSLLTSLDDFLKILANKFSYKSNPNN